MGFRVLEKFAAGKFDDPARCEDIIHASAAFYGIIDGASIGPPVGGKPSGRIISEIIAAALVSCPPGASMPEAIKHINANVREGLGYADSAAVMRHGPRPAASCAFLSVARDELWAVGDTLLMLDGREIDLTKKIDEAATLYRCAFVASMLAAGVSIETLLAEAPDYEHVRPLLAVQQESFMNRPEQKDFGYANIDGADDVLPLVRVIPLAGVKSIVMASDGYPVLHGTLKDSEDTLARMIAAEPTMHSLSFQIKGMRKGQASFDDRAYLSLVREPA